MRICMISGHACIRMQKMAMALIDAGHKVYVIANKVPNNVEEYAAFFLCSDAAQMAEAVDILSPIVDIFHVHNEPSWYVNLVKERSSVPVVLDVHDSYLARITHEQYVQDKEAGANNAIRYVTEERNNFQLADALIFPGDNFKKVVCEEYALDQESLVIPSKVPKRWYRYNTMEYFGGLVYEGKVVLPKDAIQGFAYCDYLALARETDKRSLPFHIYNGAADHKEFIDLYGEKSVVFHPGVVYRDLLKCISRHDWGLVGNITQTPEWDVAFPNKLFDYVAANVPIVAINANTSAEYIKRHKIGIVVNSIEELADRWGEHREARKNLMQTRLKLSMDEHMNDLALFYERVKHEIR